MICPNCGKEYNEKMTCCISCGADLVPFDKDSEQTAMDISQQECGTEPLIPESLGEDELSAEIIDSSGYAGKRESQSNEIIVPVYNRANTTMLSGAVKFTGSLITSVLMLAFIFLSVAAGLFRLVTDEKRISEFAHTLDVMALPAVSSSILSADSGLPDDATVQDAIYVMSSGTGLSRDDIRSIYENSTMKNFLAVQLSGYAEYIRSGESPQKITSESLKNVFRENVSLIDNTLGYSLNNHDIELACSEIERAEPFLEVISAENIEYNLGGNTLTFLRIFGSIPAIAVTSVLAVTMLIVFYAINKKGTRVLTWGGGTILAGGAAVLAVTFLFSAQLPYNESDRLVRSIIKCTCDVISPDMYRIGTTLAAAGAVMLIWAETLRRNVKS
ncbi:MAG: zinc ribbon domain-containing protein [Oscillospiraceae bacterium]|nr:zinc ribbon domain-containing protein [Oscillospiraceae bacterium]